MDKAREVKSSTGRRAEVQHRRLGDYSFTVGGCRRCSGNRRKLANDRNDPLSDANMELRMSKALNVSIVHTMFELFDGDSCFNEYNEKNKDKEIKVKVKIMNV